ncbi:MAG: GAD-like domain-containing protein [Pseudomonadota bacterium]
MIAKEMDFFLEELRQPTASQAIPEEDLTTLGETLPAVGQDYWARFGASCFMDGLVQVLNPLDFTETVASWIADTEFDGQDDYYAVAMTGFGDVEIWGGATGRVFSISASLGVMIKSGQDQAEDIAGGRADFWFEDLLIGTDPANADRSDGDGKMFKRAVKKFGPLAPGEIFVAVPSTPLGGTLQVATMDKVAAPEYLQILAGVSDRSVVTLEDLIRSAYGPDAAKAAGEL